MDESELYRCPACRGPLSAGPQTLTCPDCGSAYPIVDGVTDFLGREYAWSFGADGEQEELVRVARRAGWRAAIEAVYKDPHQQRWLTDVSRGTPVDLLGLSAGARILDVGCGWGVLSLYAAEQGLKAHALDITRPALTFLALRAREQGISSIYPARGDLVKGTPYPDHAFDAIVLNGVLEWVPAFHEGDPRELQRDLLATCRSLLKDGGRLLLGIENRIGLPYWLGYPDEHTRLKWVTLLPRRWADRLSIRKSGKPYRTYTHGRRGLRNLLSEAGFDSPSFHVPFPNYRTPEHVIDQEHRRDLWTALSNVVVEKTGIPIRHLGHLGLGRLWAGCFAPFAPAYYVLANSGPRP